MPDLRQFLVGRATPGRWVLEPDAATDRSEEEQALEVVREAVFRRFYAGEGASFVSHGSQWRSGVGRGVRRFNAGETSPCVVQQGVLGPGWRIS